MRRSLVIFDSILKSIFLRVLDVFLALVILVYFNAISIDLYAVKCFICIILCNFHVYKWDNAEIKDLLYAWRVSRNFFLYLFSWRKGGGGSLMHVFVSEHIGSLSYRTDWWLLTKLRRDEVIMALHMRLGFLARSIQRWIQGGILFIVCA